MASIKMCIDINVGKPYKSGVKIKPCQILKGFTSEQKK